MATYLLNIMQPDGPPPAPDVLNTIMADVGKVMKEIKDAGIWVFNGGLTPPGTATVVRVAEGTTVMTDGPYLEGKECVGGFVVIHADDLDAALKWATKLARAVTLPIEVRAFAFHTG